MSITINATGKKMLSESKGEFIAWNKVNPSLTVVYERKSDQIKLLIKQLRREAKALKRKIDPKYLTEKYWLTAACTKRNGRCIGDCSSGSCRECCI